MARGHPDYQTWAGRTSGGTEIKDFSFAGDISSEGTGIADLPEVEAGTEHLYQALVVSTPDDTAIHAADLTLITGGALVFFTNFITNNLSDFPGVPIPAGDQVRVTIYNFGSSTLNFKGTVFYTVRPV